MASCGSFPARKRSFLAPLDVRKIPGVGKVTERSLHACGIRKVGDLAALDEALPRRALRQMGPGAGGQVARAWTRAAGSTAKSAKAAIPKSISHEHTFSVDTAEAAALDAMLVRLSEMVARRLRDHRLWARTVQIKLRYSDFSTFTRSRTLDHATQIDTELAAAARELFHKTWTGKPIRLLGVYAQSLEATEGQTSLIEEPRTEDWRRTLAAVDKIREKYGDNISFRWPRE